jgi:hypothetical protein
MNRGDRSALNSGIDVSSWITLRWVRGTRYYRVHLEQDLWSNWLLTRVNGRIGSPLGRARSRPAPSIEDALFELAAIAQRRRKRGYRFKSRIDLNANEGDE